MASEMTSKGEQKYLAFRKSCLYEKSTRISAMILRINLKTMNSAKRKWSNPAKKFKETNITARNIEIALDC